jgi:hypothetical protein
MVCFDKLSNDQAHPQAVGRRLVSKPAISACSQPGRLSVRHGAITHSDRAGDSAATTAAGLTDSHHFVAVRAEGLNPYDPAVIVAIDLVRWEISLCALQ